MEVNSDSNDESRWERSFPVTSVGVARIRDLVETDSCDACFGEQCRAEFICKRANECFVAFAKGLKNRALARAFLGFCDAEHAADYAASRLFGFVELREGALNAEAFWISGVDTGNKRTDNTVEQLC